MGRNDIKPYYLLLDRLLDRPATVRCMRLGRAFQGTRGREPANGNKLVSLPTVRKRRCQGPRLASFDMLVQ